MKHAEGGYKRKRCVFISPRGLACRLESEEERYAGLGVVVHPVVWGDAVSFSLSRVRPRGLEPNARTHAHPEILLLLPVAQKTRDTNSCENMCNIFSQRVLVSDFSVLRLLKFIWKIWETGKTICILLVRSVLGFIYSTQH